MWNTSPGLEVCWIVACPAVTRQREVAVEFSVPDSEGMVFEAACGCFDNTEEFHMRLDRSMVGSGDSLRGYPAGVRSLRVTSSSRRLYSRGRRKRWRGSPQPPWIQPRHQLLPPRHARHPCLADLPYGRQWLNPVATRTALTLFRSSTATSRTWYQADVTNPRTLRNSIFPKLWSGRSTAVHSKAPRGFVTICWPNPPLPSRGGI